MKYSASKIKECSEWVRTNGLIEYGGARLSDFCVSLGINNQTYYRWMQKKDFADAIKKAKEEFKNNLETQLVKSLSKVASGFSWEQKTIEYIDDGLGKPKIKKQVVKNMVESPNVAAAIFLLTNINPDKWSNSYKERETSSSVESVTLSKDDGEL